MSGMPPSAVTIHILFDIAAWLVALAAFLVLRRTWFRDGPVPSDLRFGYVATLIAGAGLGAWLIGSLNLWASGVPGFGRSIQGALAGAVITVELYKRANGITARTGAVYALPVALGIAVGRIGCLYSGLDDFTHGVATGASWGWDFGDGVLRHPVQLYESLAMAGFAAVYVAMVARGSALWTVNGFYILVGFYGAQRFFLEFLKPYEPILAGLTVFQLLSVAMILYAVVLFTGPGGAEQAAAATNGRSGAGSDDRYSE